jgi:ATP-dependent RNA helicase DHX29
VPAVTNDGDDKVVAKVASLFGILEQLGFTLIEECLRSIKNLDLDDALEWVCTSKSFLRDALID